MAGRRFRAATLVHEALLRACPEALERQFPLLRNKWAAIEAKRPDILAAANTMLRETAPLPEVRLCIVDLQLLRVDAQGLRVCVV